MIASEVAALWVRASAGQCRRRSAAGQGLPVTRGGHQFFEASQPFGTEALKVVIQDIDARDVTTGEAREQRIVRERFEPERPTFAGNVKIEHQPKLTAHRVDDHRTALHVPEKRAEPASDALVQKEAAELCETRHARHVSLGGFDPECAWVPAGERAALAAAAPSPRPSCLREYLGAPCGCSACLWLFPS
jgi:hypothetical protein